VSAVESGTCCCYAMRSTLLVAVALGATACGSLGNREQGVFFGVSSGPAEVGRNPTASTVRGAIIGAMVGGTVGRVIGHQMDQQAHELKVAIPGATVERLAEGIQITFPPGLLFHADSDALRLDAARNLQKLAASMKRYPHTELLLVAHTDAPGSQEYNQDLSTRRANSAAAYLTTEGIGPNRVHTPGRGALEALASNETDTARKQNQRIEVAIYAAVKARTMRQH